MTKIAKIKTISNANEFVNILNNKELLIYEDVQGSKIFINWNGNKFVIKTKSIKNEPLNFVDLAIQKFYNKAFEYFHTLPAYVTELLNTNWWFCFEYFPDMEPANIKYSRIPKNNLILSCIVKGKEYVYDYDELKEYTKLFDVEDLPIVFKGKLSKKQLEIIELYLNTKEKDLKFLFNEDNFAYFFYKILNPRINNSFLMNNEEFNNNLEKIVIKIDGRSKYSFEILNPLYHKMELTNNSEYVEIYSLILLNFLEFCQLIDLTKINLFKITKEELYVEFISLLFNDYMSNIQKNIMTWDFTIPQFFKDDKFKINLDLISNDITKNFIKSDDKIEYAFKCVLGSFNSKKKNPVGVFTDMTLKLFNNFVDKLDIIIDNSLKINRETELQKDDLKDFKTYFKLKYNADAGDDIYPDVYDEFQDKEDKKKGKNKKIKGKSPDKNIDNFQPKKEEL